MLKVIKKLLFDWPNYGINLYNVNSPLHSGDIIIVTGKTNGVDDDGHVHLHVNNIVNKGVE